MKQLAIIGPTASGKSDLAIKVAKKLDAYILSIDSLSIYKEIDVVSAKPSKEELQSIRHFGIDVLNPDDYFSVDIFIRLYNEVISTCQKEKKNLIIVGGTSFYLKSLLEGLSSLPEITKEVSRHVEIKLKDKETYNFLLRLDEEYMRNISPNDSYRIEKALLIYEASGLTPSEWFKRNPPIPTIKNLDIFNIDVDRTLLRERIAKRTAKMVDTGLLDEVCYLEQKYTRFPHAMNSIGIVEVLEYLDGKVTLEEMINNLSIHTAQLAKRQQTFNRTQFENVINAPLEELKALILAKYL
ncbi:MAG: tRNA (adenosine(37)-N6)-dimethylallyltransferase MiaA [Epsilonproteobacteria bacterium]|nr:tRNA (adenosine(37)-N6)-dimethylallyltransferase MiaA [Campylobacterota bacterium]OIO15013.1 MAG: tRNA (adenosine(37)-N6)-dimethylallyltransferase MiaA [Helicobacteraceae bacterium CG1_02_36_14]PIP10530.1 MAG: tRNA (adenosine(37)-N6)-dimethylallyltransferase MiaA [Sulfurimonas sp. CG23_combo_of_CG06-09_8_20_14_all_36_33]PIS26980.1 MAG: tRNA (adenosine(37)-N6)-dimethylallyltransferase MiaA [Sulfurimonas sp. CG08_land_8_20_14_0_20_36_33]PIU35874.1 MAG: tRNA (adenosine(37)-N6)-dimethylallyltran